MLFSIYSQKSLKSHRLKIIVRHTILIPLEEQNNLSLFFPAENIQHPIAVISIITKQGSLSTPVLQLQHPVIVSCIQKLRHITDPLLRFYDKRSPDIINPNFIHEI